MHAARRLLLVAGVLAAAAAAEYTPCDDANDPWRTRACGGCAEGYGALGAQCVECSAEAEGLGVVVAVETGAAVAALCLLAAVSFGEPAGSGVIQSALFAGNMAHVALHLAAPKVTSWGAGVASLSVTAGMTPLMGECMTNSVSTLSLKLISWAICLTAALAAGWFRIRILSVLHVTLVTTMPPLVLYALAIVPCNGACSDVPNNAQAQAWTTLFAGIVLPLASNVAVLVVRPEDYVAKCRATYVTFPVARMRDEISSADSHIHITETVVFGNVLSRWLMHDALLFDFVFRHVKTLSLVLAAGVPARLSEKWFLTGTVALLWLFSSLLFQPYHQPCTAIIDSAVLMLLLLTVLSFGSFMTVGADVISNDVAVGLPTSIEGFLCVCYPLLMIGAWACVIRILYPDSTESIQSSSEAGQGSIVSDEVGPRGIREDSSTQLNHVSELGSRGRPRSPHHNPPSVQPQSDLSIVPNAFRSSLKRAEVPINPLQPQNVRFAVSSVSLPGGSPTPNVVSLTEDEMDEMC
ncbi:hypothetical protein DIPPA_02926 [Diplonema papillatum]|nr:hypothetical protein DIPPA_02926 [Diplonema papillatum]|eukprot:gene16474-25261_t